jgi:phosphoglycerate dehydrogenase-like enzyme
LSDAINVTIALPLAGDLVERIRSVSSGLHVKHLTRMQRYVYREGRPLWAGYDERPDRGDEDEDSARSALEGVLAGTEVLLTNPVVPEDLSERAPGLRWLQLTSAGADRLLQTDLVRSRRIEVATASGLHATPISEYVIGAIAAFAKGIIAARSAQLQHAWQPYIPREMEGATVGIVGFGAIGRRVAELANAFGMRVLVVRRSIRERMSGSDAGTPVVESFFPPGDLGGVLAECDYLVLAVPLTDETRGLIADEELRVMKPGAVIVNIARGAVIDQQALLAALSEGRIGGAALDVTDPEPLPGGDALWDAPNVLITPHVSGATPRYMERAIDIFCDNLGRYVSGTPLRNVVDPDRGY